MFFFNFWFCNSFIYTYTYIGFTLFSVNYTEFSSLLIFFFFGFIKMVTEYAAMKREEEEEEEERERFGMFRF